VEISICASAAESGQVETPQAIKSGHTAMPRWTASGQKGPEPGISELRRGAQLAGAERGRRATDAAEVRFDCVEAFGQRHGCREASALDAEAGLRDNPARILELVAEKAISAGWERLNGRHGTASLDGGPRLALRSILLLSSRGRGAGPLSNHSFAKGADSSNPACSAKKSVSPIRSGAAREKSRLQKLCAHARGKRQSFRPRIYRHFWGVGRPRRRDGTARHIQIAALSRPAEFSAVSSLAPEIAAQIRRAEEDADSTRCNGCRAAILMTHLRIEAPFGLADLFALRLKPNPRRNTSIFARTSADVQRRWPELVIDNEPHDFSGVN